MVSMNDVPVNDLIEKAAESLKKVPEIKAPEWARFVKTGMHKERPPVNPDWWHMRAAAILRTVAKVGPVGVSKLRTKYGGRKNRGHKPDKFYRGSGSIIRKIFQQLEKAQLIKQADKHGKKGRVIAPKGASLLSRAALEASKNPPKKDAVEKAEQPKQPVETQPKNIQPIKKQQPMPEAKPAAKAAPEAKNG